MTLDDRQRLVADALAGFPEHFGLRGFPGDVFRCSPTHSYVNDAGTVTIYTERLAAGAWLAFAKGSVAELQRELAEVPATFYAPLFG